MRLGQAAPTIDEISPLSTRELELDLDTRGIFDIFHKKLDKDTQKLVDTVSIDADCRMFRIYSKVQKAHLSAQKLMTAEEASNGTNEKRPVKKEYKKRIDEFAKSAKKAGKKVEDLQKKLKKLGVTDPATQCKSRSSSTSSLHSTSSHTSSEIEKREESDEKPVKAKLTQAERDYRINNKLCLHCGKSGHTTANHPR